MFEVDQAHKAIDLFEGRMTRDVWASKYKWQVEKHPNETFARVAKAIMERDGEEYVHQAYEAMSQGLWLPGGRILAGAGTAKRVTLMNCYVNATVKDSMEGIMDAHTNAALTLQQGGGIGTDFSTLRPEGALLSRTHTKASGPLPFMRMWDSMSRTIRSAGDRRGAMMGTMIDTHPDLLKFISAKQEKGALEQFNVSILVSDALMEAVREGEDWMFYFPKEPMSRPAGLAELDFNDEDTGIRQYVYNVMPARELWEIITKATYEYSEPGVIFVDRVNAMNNLHYCETIQCTNPCGEQPLPPHGTCNLGHVNLARCVKDPFKPSATIDVDLIKEVVRLGVRFLDNVIDVTGYPLEQQQQEETMKRRLGLGYTGLADLLAQLGVRYGSPDAARITEEVTRLICFTAYETSIELAKERGPFILLDKDQYLSGYSFAHTMLPTYIQDGIRKYGIRNALLMTIAPTGTGSILYGNVSSGGEPVFLHQTQRRVLRSTPGFKDEWDHYVEWGYGARLYKSLYPAFTELPAFMVTAADLSVEDHVVMQAAAQKWIDASISKTINVPKEMPYEQFVKVYDLAYSLGCKGCTTYRPSDIRGSVLSAPTEARTDEPEGIPGIVSVRPDMLRGYTYKIKWPTIEAAIYLTVNEDEHGNAFECFLQSKDARVQDWTTALTTLITAIWRSGMDAMFVAQELQQVQSLHDGAFKEGKHHPSLVAYIGFKLEQHISGASRQLAATTTAAMTTTTTSQQPTAELNIPGVQCPKCRQRTMVFKEGCKSCTSCGYSTCG